MTKTQFANQIMTLADSFNYDKQEVDHEKNKYERTCKGPESVCCNRVEGAQ
jgi:hypothetical protein